MHPDQSQISKIPSKLTPQTSQTTQHSEKKGEDFKMRLREAGTRLDAASDAGERFDPLRARHGLGAQHAQRSARIVHLHCELPGRHHSRNTKPRPKLTSKSIALAPLSSTAAAREKNRKPGEGVSL